MNWIGFGPTRSFLSSDISTLSYRDGLIYLSLSTDINTCGCDIFKRAYDMS